MGLLDLIAGSALGPIGSIGMRVVKSDKFWKVILVFTLAAVIWFGFSSYRVMAGELAVVQQDYADAEEALLQQVTEIEKASTESLRVQNLLATISREKNQLRISLDKSLIALRKAEKDLDAKNDAEFIACLDVTLPDSYFDSLYDQVEDQ